MSYILGSHKKISFEKGNILIKRSLRITELDDLSGVTHAEISLILWVNIEQNSCL